MPLTQWSEVANGEPMRRYSVGCQKGKRWKKGKKNNSTEQNRQHNFIFKSNSKCENYWGTTTKWNVCEAIKHNQVIKIKQRKKQNKLQSKQASNNNCDNTNNIY